MEGAERGSRGALALLFLLGGAGCTERSFRWVPTQNAASLLVLQYTGDNSGDAAFRPDDLVSITAYAVPKSDAITFELPSSVTSALALAYPDSLSLLELVEGPVGKVEVGRALPVSTQMARLDVSAHVLGPWRPITSLPGAVGAVQIARPNACAEFEPAYASIDNSATELPLATLALDGTRALVATTGGRFFTYGAAGLTALTDLTPATPHQAAFKDATGEIWLAGPQGKVAHGTLERGFVPAPPMIHGLKDYGVLMTGAPSGQAFELFAVTASMAVERFDGTSWRELLPPTQVSALTTRAYLSWIAPGKVAVLGFASNRVVEVDQTGRTESFDLRLVGPDALYVVSYVPGMGPMIGTRYGVLFRRTDTWSELPMAPTTDRADFLIGYGEPGGYLVGGESGAFVQYIPGFGYCPPQRAVLGRAVDRVVVLGEDLVFGVGFADSDIRLAYARKR